MFQTRALRRHFRAGTVAMLSVVLGACATVPETEPRAETAGVEAPAAPPAAVPAAVPAPPTPPPQPVFRPAAPKQYVVQPGDTLWSIANTFLRDPWYWPEIWVANPQIRNPHQIFPGDVLSIYYRDHVPGISDQEPRVMVTERLSPRVRFEELDDTRAPITTLQPFMFQPRVLDEATLAQAPHIVAAQDERLIFGSGDRVYIRNAPDAKRYDLYHVVRRDRMLRDPDTGEELGVATLPIAQAEIVRSGEIATAVLRNSEREALRGDRLIGFEDRPDLLFDISRPPVDLEGQVIMLFDAITQVGKLQAVVINRGSREGVKNGQVFAIWEAGRTAVDPIADTMNARILLPEERAGTMMVFRTFDKVAYALVLQAVRPIREGFKARHP